MLRITNVSKKSCKSQLGHLVGREPSTSVTEIITVTEQEQLVSIYKINLLNHATIHIWGLVAWSRFKDVIKYISHPTSTKNNGTIKGKKPKSLMSYK